jgi:hypothetical protein
MVPLTRNQREAQALAETRRMLREIAGTLKTAMIIALPLLLRAVCVGAVVVGAAHSLAMCWHAYGSDVPALIPAAVITVTPVVVVVLAQPTWGSLLLAGVVMLALGWIVPVLPVEWRTILIMAVIAGSILHHLITNERTKRDEQQERQSVGVAVDLASASIQHVSEPGPDCVHDGQ